MPEVKDKYFCFFQTKENWSCNPPSLSEFSNAGWRNPDDKRNQLFKEFVQIVDELQPEMFVMENVPGILTMRKGEAFKEILHRLSNRVQRKHNLN